MRRTIRRRRKEAKTDYGKRMKLLKSGKARIVYRATNKNIISQYVSSKNAQDKVELTINSKDLMKHGWDKKAEGSLKSTTASYLTGFLMGKTIVSKKLETPITDLGMTRVLHKAKVYAFLKGLIDAGVKIECKEEAFPSEDRIKGEHLKNKIDFNKIKSSIEK